MTADVGRARSWRVCNADGVTVADVYRMLGRFQNGRRRARRISPGRVRRNDAGRCGCREGETMKTSKRGEAAAFRGAAREPAAARGTA